MTGCKTGLTLFGDSDNVELGVAAVGHKVEGRRHRKDGNETILCVKRKNRVYAGERWVSVGSG
jgi:hypothetical protein